jgi:hypothetical protein
MLGLITFSMSKWDGYVGLEEGARPRMPENCETILQTPNGPANIGFRPRTLAAAERCRFKTRFLSEPGGKCGLAGAGCKSWLGSASWRWSASVFESGIFGAGEEVSSSDNEFSQLISD